MSLLQQASHTTSTSCTRYSPTNCPLTTVVSFFSGRALRHRPKYSQLLDVRSPGHECEDRQSIKVASLGRMTKPSASVRGFTTGKRRSQWSKKSPNCWQIYERLDVFIHKTTTLVSSSYKTPHSLSHSVNTSYHSEISPYAFIRFSTLPVSSFVPHSFATPQGRHPRRHCSVVGVQNRQLFDGVAWPFRS